MQATKTIKKQDEGCQVQCLQVDEGVQVNTSKLLSNSMGLNDHKKMLLSVSSLKQFIEGQPKLSFPTESVKDLNSYVPTKIDNEVLFMKSRVRDIFFCLLMKDNVTNEDYESVIIYFQENFQLVQEFFRVLWDKINGGQKDIMDYKIESIDKLLDLRLSEENYESKVKQYKKLYTILKDSQK